MLSIVLNLILHLSQGSLFQVELSWPSTWVAGRIELSSNHESYSTDVLLYLGASSNISEFYASIRVPQLKWTYSCTINEMTGLDFSLICKDLPLKQGTYGPVELTLRASETGLILAKDINFGVFAVIDTEPDTSYEGLTIKYDGNVRSVAEPCALVFNFTLDKVLNKFDYFVLSLNDRFEYKPENLTWNTEFNGSNFFLSSSWVYNEEERKVYIFGNPDDVSLTLNIGFSLSGFTIPGSIVSQFVWVMEIRKFAVNSVTKRMIGFGPTSSIEKGIISKATWSLVHPEITASEIVDSQVTYTKIEFVNNHTVPVGGKILVTYSGVLICSYTYTNEGTHFGVKSDESKKDCGLIYNTTDLNSVLSCVVTKDTELSCLVQEASLSRNAVVSIYNLIEFDGDGKISNITISDPDGNLIDSLSDSLKFSIGFNNLASIDHIGFILSETNTTQIYKAGDFGTYGFLIQFTTDRTLAKNENFTIYLPVQLGSNAEEKFAVLGDKVYGKYAVDEYGNTFDQIPESSFKVATKFNVSQGNITVIFEEEIPGDSTFSFYIGNKNSEDAISNIFMPLFPTFLDDLSQVFMRVLTEDVKLIFTSPYYIEYNSLNTRFVPFCNNTFYPGLPIEVFISIGYYLKSYSSSFYALYEFDDLDSGLEPGADFPSSPAGASLYDAKTVKFSFLSFRQDVEQSFLLPFNKMNSEVLNLTTSLFVLTPLGKSYKIATGSYKANYTGIESVAIETLTNIENELPQQVVKFDVVIDVSTEDTIRIAVFGSLGFSFNYLKIVDGLGYESFHIKDLSYNSVFIVDDTTISETQGTYHLQVNTPWFTNSDNIVYIAYASGGELNNTKCTQIFSQAIPINSPLPLSLTTFSPDTITSFTFGRKHFDAFLNFKFEGTMLKGFYMNITAGELSLEQVSLIGFTSKEEIYFSTDDNLTWVSSEINEDFEGSFRLKILGFDLPVIYSQHNLTVLDTLFVYDSLDRLCYTWQQENMDGVVVFEPGNIQSDVSSASNILVFPDVIDSNFVQFHVNFKISNYLPSGSIIYLKADFLKDENPSDNLWTDFIFTSCFLKSPILSLVTGEDLYEGRKVTLIKDLAFNLTESKHKNLAIWAVKDDLFYIFDDYEAINSQYFAANRKVKPSVTFSTSSLSEQTSGFESFHNFTFSLNTSTSPDWLFIFDFSKNYDINIGKFTIFEYIPGIKYLQGSVNDQTLYCEVENWFVYCQPDLSFSSLTAISISFSVINPSSPGKVNLYIQNQTSHIAVSPFYSFYFNYSQIPSSIISIKSIKHETENQEDSIHSLIIEAYLGIETNKGDYLEIVAPEQYQLKVNNRDDVKCMMTYDANTSFVYNSLCPTFANSIRLYFDNVYKFNQAFPVSFTISGLINPVSGYERKLREFEPEFYEIWTQNFQIFYRTGAKVLARTFDNLNAGFTGFNLTKYTRLVVNNGEMVKLVPGVSFYNFSLTTGGKLLAKSIEINGTVDSNSGIELSDMGKYKISMSQQVVSFSITASPDTAEGIYYIYWSIKETPYISSSYHAPLPTKILVKKDSKFEIQLPSSLQIPDSILSQPYTLVIPQHNSLSVSPSSSISIQLSQSDPTLPLVEFFPNPVNITRSESSAYFSILCLNCSLGRKINFKGQVLNSDRFYFQSESWFKVQENSQSPGKRQIFASFTNPSTLKISIETESPGMAYWVLLSEDLLEKDSSLITRSTIELNSYDYIDPAKSYLQLSSQIEKYKQGLDALLAETLAKGQSYQNFVPRAENYARSTYFTSISGLSSGSNDLVTLAELVPGARYFFRVYIQDFSGQETVSSTFLSDSSILQAGKLSLSFNKTSPSTDVLIKRLAQVYQLETYMFSTITTSRRLQNQARFLASVQNLQVFSSITEGKSGYDLAGSVSLEDLQENLQNFELIEFDVSQLDPLDFSKLEWLEIDGDEWDYGDEVLHFNFTLTASGKMMCLVETDPDLNLMVDEQMIVAGICRNGSDCWEFRYEVAVVMGNQMWDFNFTEKGYEEDRYSVSCLVCNQYPGEPSCTGIKNTTLDYFRVDLSRAAALLAAFAWIVI